MPSGNRRLPRTVRNTIPLMSGFVGESSRYSPLGAAVPTLPALEQPLPPKHFPFPNTPVDDDLFFETLTFLFSVFSAGLQFLHLYRTVWWLPHSYTNHALNFYLIDPNLVVFIIVLLSRRLIFILGCRTLDRIIVEKYHNLSHTCYKFVLFSIISFLLVCCSYYVIQSHPLVNLCYLVYPILVYLILFGIKISPFLELWNGTILPPLHACRTSAMEIRQEVDYLKINFNNRMKQILFCSVINAYYAGFVPCCFAQNFLHYDIYWASQHVLFIFLSSFVSYTIHTLSLRYCDILHRSALHLGNWDKLSTRNILLVNNSWNEEMLWPFGALVRYGRDIYRSVGECNASEPGNAASSRFYIFFKNPSIPLGLLMGFHVSMIFLQLILLIRTVLWYKIISVTFLLFYNYHILYKIARDYLISSKMYKEENSMHNKYSIR